MRSIADIQIDDIYRTFGLVQQQQQRVAQVLNQDTLHQQMSRVLAEQEQCMSGFDYNIMIQSCTDFTQRLQPSPRTSNKKENFLGAQTCSSNPRNCQQEEEQPSVSKFQIVPRAERIVQNDDNLTQEFLQQRILQFMQREQDDAVKIVQEAKQQVTNDAKVAGTSTTNQTNIGNNTTTNKQQVTSANNTTKSTGRKQKPKASAKLLSNVPFLKNNGTLPQRTIDAYSSSSKTIATRSSKSKASDATWQNFGNTLITVPKIPITAQQQQNNRYNKNVSD